MYQFSKTIHFSRQFKFVTKKYGCTVSTFLANLIDQHDLRTSTGKNVTSFYLSRKQIADDTGIKRKAQIKCEEVLTSIRFIKMVTRDYNANIYTIDYQEIENQAPPTGAPSTIASQVPVPATLSVAPTSSIQQLPFIAPRQVGSPSLLEEGEAPSSGAGDLPTRVRANYISTRSTTKPVSIPERTVENVTAKTNVEDSCIKEESTCIPVKKSSSPEQLARRYSAAMGLPFRQQDMPRVYEAYTRLLSVEHLLNPIALGQVWKNYTDETTKVDCKEPWISGFITYRVLDQLIKHRDAIATYCTSYCDRKLEAVFKANSRVIDGLVRPMGYSCDIAGSVQPLEGERFFTPKDERKLRSDLLREYLIDLLPSEDKNDMMKVLEAI